MTTTERLAWFTAGAATTVASLAALAVHWGRAAARTEGYGTWMAEPTEPVTWQQYWRESVDYARMQEAARVNWHRETRHVGPPLRVERAGRASAAEAGAVTPDDRPRRCRPCGGEAVAAGAALDRSVAVSDDLARFIAEDAPPPSIDARAGGTSEGG